MQQEKFNEHRMSAHAMDIVYNIMSYLTPKTHLILSHMRINIDPVIQIFWQTLMKIIVVASDYKQGFSWPESISELDNHLDILTKCDELITSELRPLEPLQSFLLIWPSDLVSDLRWPYLYLYILLSQSFSQLMRIKSNCYL